MYQRRFARESKYLDSSSNACHVGFHPRSNQNAADGDRAPQGVCNISRRHPKRNMSTAAKSKTQKGVESLADSLLNRSSWNSSTAIHYDPKPAPIFPPQRHRNKRPSGRGRSRPAQWTKYHVRKPTTDAQDIVNQSTNQRTTREKDNGANTSCNRPVHNCISAGCNYHTIKGPCTFPKAGRAPIRLPDKNVRKSKTVTFRTSRVSKSDHNCATGSKRARRASDSERMSPGEEGVLFNYDSSCSKKPKPCRKKSALKKLSSSSRHELHTPDREKRVVDSGTQSPDIWNRGMYMPTRSISESNNYRVALPNNSYAQFNPSVRTHGELGNYRSENFRNHFENLSEKYFGDSALLQPGLMSCFSRLDAIKKSDFLKEYGSESLTNFSRNRCSNLNATCGSELSMPDSIERCTKALQALRLKESELMDKYMFKKSDPSSSGFYQNKRNEWRSPNHLRPNLQSFSLPFDTRPEMASFPSFSREPQLFTSSKTPWSGSPFGEKTSSYLDSHSWREKTQYFGFSGAHSGHFSSPKRCYEDKRPCSTRTTWERSLSPNTFRPAIHPARHDNKLIDEYLYGDNGTGLTIKDVTVNASNSAHEQNNSHKKALKHYSIPTPNVQKRLNRSSSANPREEQILNGRKIHRQQDSSCRPIGCSRMPIKQPNSNSYCKNRSKSEHKLADAVDDIYGGGKPQASHCKIKNKIPNSSTFYSEATAPTVVDETHATPQRSKSMNSLCDLEHSNLTMKPNSLVKSIQEEQLRLNERLLKLNSIIS